MSQPILHSGLMDAAVALLLASECNLVGHHYKQIGLGPMKEHDGYLVEEQLARGREAAADYLCRAFGYAQTALEDDDEQPAEGDGD
jgi:hypothetical protein